MENTLKPKLEAEDVLRLLAILISIFIFPQLKNHFVFVLFFFVLLVITITRIWQNNLKDNSLFLVVEIILSGLAILFTGHLNSPFLIYLLTAFISSSKNLPAGLLFFSSVFVFITLNLSLILSNLFASYGFITNTFIAFFILLAVLSRRNSKEEKLKQSISYTNEKLFENLKQSSRNFKNASTMADLYREMLRFLSQFGIQEFLVYFPNLESFYYVHSADNPQVENITTQIDFEPRYPPDVITFIGKEFSVQTNLPDIVIYLPEKELGDLEQNFLKLGADFAAYRAAEIYLSESEKQLLERFSALYDASQMISSEPEVKQAIEFAATSVKKMTGMQKSVVCLCELPEKINEAFNDPEKTVVKGRLEEHPEKIWLQGFLKAAAETIKNKKPVIAQFTKFGANLLCLPITYGDRVFGVIAGITSLEKAEAIKDLRTMEIIASILALYLANLELIKKREAAAVSQERDRIAREMHDNQIQSLFSLLLLVETFANEVSSNPEVAKERLEEIKKRIQNIIKETREMIVRLYPSSLSAEGFDRTIKKMLSSFKGIEFEFDLEPLPENVSFPLQNAILRITQEAVNNAVKHGNANKIYISLKNDSSSLILTIKDNGNGFDISKLETFIDSKNHFGISSIIYRTKSFGGSYELDSAPGKGTEWKIVFPLKPDHET